MSKRIISVATSAELNDALRAHLLRADGQEDICLATYAPSTGVTRTSALIRSFVQPMDGDRQVHGNASINGTYVVRAATVAAERGEGLALCHSHPTGRGWQFMSGPDRDAEASFANLAREITGLPLVGLTIAGGDAAWSARSWDQGVGSSVACSDAENVRVVGPVLHISWNDRVRPGPAPSEAQFRTISCWGEEVQRDIARRRVLIAGLGSVGLDVAVRLASTGFTDVGLMDFDLVERRNLDRLIGAKASDIGTRKIDLAAKLMLTNATAQSINISRFDLSICEPQGHRAALDYDLIFSCVDRPWPRAVLNQIAYTELIPVIDGGLAIDAFPKGGMRNATWRSHVLAPGLPCLECSRQLDASEVSLDVAGLLDDPQYIAGADRKTSNGSNVAILSISAAASLLSQFVSLNVAPGGFGARGPLQYVLSTHTLEHLPFTTNPHCRWEAAVAAGDARVDLTGSHGAAEAARTTWAVSERPIPPIPGRFLRRLRRRLQPSGK